MNKESDKFGSSIGEAFEETQAREGKERFLRELYENVTAFADILREPECDFDTGVEALTNFNAAKEEIKKLELELNEKTAAKRVERLERVAIHILTGMTQVNELEGSPEHPAALKRLFGEVADKIDGVVSRKTGVSKETGPAGSGKKGAEKNVPPESEAVLAESYRKLFQLAEGLGSTSVDVKGGIAILRDIGIAAKEIKAMEGSTANGGRTIVEAFDGIRAIADKRLNAEISVLPEGKKRDDAIKKLFKDLSVMIGELREGGKKGESKDQPSPEAPRNQAPSLEDIVESLGERKTPFEFEGRKVFPGTLAETIKTFFRKFEKKKILESYGKDDLAEAMTDFLDSIPPGRNGTLRKDVGELMVSKGYVSETALSEFLSPGKKAEVVSEAPKAGDTEPRPAPARVVKSNQPKMRMTTKMPEFDPALDLVAKTEAAEKAEKEKGPEATSKAPKKEKPAASVVNFNKEKVPSASEFTIDAGIQIPEFQKFLERYDDAETVDMADESLFKTRYEAFLAHVDVVKAMKGLIDGEFKDMGLKLEGAQMKRIEDLVVEYSVENPEKVAEMKEQFDKAVAMESKIKDYERMIEGATGGKGEEELAKSHEEGREKLALLIQARDSSKFLALQEGFLNVIGESMLKRQLSKENFTIGKKAIEQQLAHMRRERDAVAARQKVEADYKIEGKDAIQAEIDKLKKEVDAYESRLLSISGYKIQKEGVMEQFESTRQFIVKQFVPGEILNEMAQASVRRELDKLSSSDPAKAEEFWNDLDAASAGNPYDLDLKEGVDAQEVEGKINAAFEKEAAEELADAAKSLGSANKGFDGFLKKLGEMGGKERIGSKTGTEVKGFLGQLLEGILAKVPADDKQRTAKTLMLRRAMVSLK